MEEITARVNIFKRGAQAVKYVGSVEPFVAGRIGIYWAQVLAYKLPRDRSIERSLQKIQEITLRGREEEIEQEYKFKWQNLSLYDYSNTPPQSKPQGALPRLRSYVNFSNPLTVSGFVNPSASWSPVGMNLISSNFRATLSLTKWKSTSMCYVRAWKIGFAER